MRLFRLRVARFALDAFGLVVSDYVWRPLCIVERALDRRLTDVCLRVLALDFEIELEEQPE